MKYPSIIIAILLILAACAPPEQPSRAKELADQLREEVTEPEAEKTTEEAEEPAETPEPTQELVPETAPETAEEITEAEAIEETVSPAQTRTKMYKFLDIFAAKVTSYEFTYKGDKYHVRGSRYKIILKNPATVKDVSFGDIRKNLFYYDTVYVDRATKTAIAYCEGHSSQVNTQCSQLEIYDLAYPAPFQDYDITLPEDWLFTYLDREPNTWDENKYYIQSRASITVTFEGDPTLELDFDPGSGLVMRADQKSGNRLVSRQDYEKLATNLVREKDVYHRSKSEIPSEETFYK
jgi:hypothetical protein